MRRLLRKKVTRRWAGEAARISAILGDLRADRDWTRRLLRDDRKGWGQLAEIDSCPLDTLPGEAAPRDLRGLALQDLDLSGIQGLADSCLDYAQFDTVMFKAASFVGASLKFVSFRSASILDEARFGFADLTSADLRNLSIVGADFSNAELGGADFRGSAIRGARFLNVRYQIEGPVGFLGVGNAPTRFGGVGQESRLLGQDSNPGIRVYVAQQSGQHELWQRHPGLARLSYCLTNFGESPARLFIWTTFVWLFFGFLYLQVPLPAQLCGTAAGDFLLWANGARPQLVDSATLEPVREPIRALYFSAVTLSTLGFGDIVPAENSLGAFLAIAAESLLGCVLLGAFVSVLLHSFTPSRE